jgi:hypothetical protein
MTMTSNDPGLPIMPAFYIAVIQPGRTKLVFHVKRSFGTVTGLFHVKRPHSRNEHRSEL